MGIRSLFSRLRERDGTKLDCVLLVVGCVLVFANSIPGGFVWDDIMLIVKNPFLGRSGDLAKLLTTPFLTRPGQVGAVFYRPMVFLTLFLDSLPLGRLPFVFHLANIVWHAACTVLVYLVLRKLFASRGIAVVGGAIFALHPVHSESVAWISGRTDLICGTFLLLALLMHLKHRESDGKGWYLPVAGISTAAAMFSKELALAFPLLAALADYVYMRGKRLAIRELARPYLVYAAAALLYASVRTSALSAFAASKASASPSPQVFAAAPFIERLLGLPLNFWRYVEMLVWPSYARPFLYYKPMPFEWSAALAGSWAAFILVLVIVICFRRKHPALFFGAAWFGLTLLPASNLVQLPGTNMAERFLYVPSVGFAAIAGWAFAAVFGEKVGGLRPRAQEHRLWPLGQHHEPVEGCS